MIAYMLIVLGFLMRLIPHIPNAAPIAAIAIFAGATLNRKLVPWVPLAIMIASDLIIGMHDVVFYTWGAFMLIGIFGTRLKESRTPLGICGYAIGSALFFFAVTNFGVFLTWYPHTMQGFADCYIKAVPFFRTTLISNVVFSFVLFGVYDLAGRLVRETKYSRILLAD